MRNPLAPKCCAQAGYKSRKSWVQLGGLINSVFLGTRGVCEKSQFIPGFYPALQQAYPQPSTSLFNLLICRLSTLPTGLTNATTI